MLEASKIAKINSLHDLFKTPSIARIANRLVFNRFSEENQEYLLVVNKDNSTDVLPLRQGFSLSLLNQTALSYYHITNRKKQLTVSYTNYEYARKKMLLEPRITFPISNEKPSLFGSLKDIAKLRVIEKSEVSLTSDLSNTLVK